MNSVSNCDDANNPALIEKESFVNFYYVYYCLLDNNYWIGLPLAVFFILPI